MKISGRTGVDAIKTENKIREKTGDNERTTYGKKQISKIREPLRRTDCVKNREEQEFY